jgi:hypothetical protein
MLGAGFGEHDASVGGFGDCQTEVDVSGRVQADAGVSMFVVVPLGEGVHESARFTIGSIDAIRGTLACPHNREMLESVRAPLTFDRFWQNLVHAVGRTGLRYDRDPHQAQHCGTGDA